MSDIDLHFTVWDVFIYGCTLAIVPIAIVAATFCVLYWRKWRNGFMLAGASVSIALTCAGAYGFAMQTLPEWISEANVRADVASRTRTLASDETIAGMRVRAGSRYTSFGAEVDGERIASLALSSPTSWHGIPIEGHFEFDQDGPNGDIRLSRDARIDGVACEHGESVRMLAGKLWKCTIAGISRVSGVPCSGEITVESASSFDCTVGRTYRVRGITFLPGTTWSASSDDVVASVGTRAPSISLFGKPLAGGDLVKITKAYVEVEADRPAVSRTCDARLYRITSAGRVTAASYAGCTVQLPANALRL